MDTEGMVETNGRQISLRAGGETIIELRVLGTLTMAWLLMQRLGYNCSLLQMLKVLRGIRHSLQALVGKR